MPRGPRLDAPRALQHMMLRGIERYRLVATTADRRDFVARLLAETQTACCAWVLMPNYVHVLLRTGRAPLATVMRRLLTGYAVRFSRRPVSLLGRLTERPLESRCHVYANGV
jgi:REP element-mobilizing transposase RayT